MARVTVSPETFEYVDFDAGEIAAVAADVCDRIGIPGDTEVAVTVEEAELMGRVLDVTAADGRIDVTVTGGAFEDLHRARQFSVDRARSTLGLVLLRAKDRLDPAFGDAPADADLTVEQWTAWETYAEGRFGRAGFPTRQSRRLYHFRLRHGFSDEIDAAFERLWSADGLTWADIDATCHQTSELDPGPLV